MKDLLHGLSDDQPFGMCFEAALAPAFAAQVDQVDGGRALKMHQENRFSGISCTTRSSASDAPRRLKPQEFGGPGFLDSVDRTGGTNAKRSFWSPKTSEARQCALVRPKASK